MFVNSRLKGWIWTYHVIRDSGGCMPSQARWVPYAQIIEVRKLGNVKSKNK